MMNFDWSFSDSSPTDYQTAYQVRIFSATGASIVDTGKVASGVKRYTRTITSGNKDTAASLASSHLGL